MYTISMHNVYSSFLYRIIVFVNAYLLFFFLFLFFQISLLFLRSSITSPDWPGTVKPTTLASLTWHRQAHCSSITDLAQVSPLMQHHCPGTGKPTTAASLSWNYSHGPPCLASPFFLFSKSQHTNCSLQLKGSRVIEDLFNEQTHTWKDAYKHVWSNWGQVSVQTLKRRVMILCPWDDPHNYRAARLKGPWAKAESWAPTVFLCLYPNILWALLIFCELSENTRRVAKRLGPTGVRQNTCLGSIPALF